VRRALGKEERRARLGSDTCIGVAALIDDESIGLPKDLPKLATSLAIGANSDALKEP
jgi:hypothetical protein